MSVHTPAKSRGKMAARLASTLVYDGAVATTMLRTFQYFLVSVSFIAGISPGILFTLLVGWQLTHAAIWLGGLSLLTGVPSVYAVLAASRRELVVSGALHAGREFWRSFVGAFRSLWWLAVAVLAIAVMLAYDLAIIGGIDSAFLIIGAVAVVVLILVVGLCILTVENGPMQPLELLVSATRLILRRPHIALSWGMLIALGVLASMIPVVGPAIMLFAPAAVGAAIIICNTALGFIPDHQELDA